MPQQYTYTVCLLLLAVTIALQASTDAFSSPISKHCKNYIKAFDKEKYDDARRHKGWYFMWWTGDCSQVPYPDWWTCTSESYAWNRYVDLMISEAKLEQKEGVASQTCKIGRLMGLEWAKDNNIRCIHTHDLGKLEKILTDNNRPAADRLQEVKGRISDLLKTRGCTQSNVN